MSSILRVLETCLYVDNLAEAERFYRQVLGLEVYSRQLERHVFFRCGPGMLLVFQREASQLPGETPSHGSQGAGHVAFAIRGDEFDAWRHRLATHQVEIERELEWPGGGRSIYFRDPAGNSLELAQPSIWKLAN